MIRLIKTFFILLLIFSITKTTLANDYLPYPSIRGKTGVLRTLSAKGMKSGTFSFSSRWSYFSQKDFLVEDDENTRLEGSTGITIGLPYNLETSIILISAGHEISSDDAERDQFVQTMGDIETGLKYYYSILPSLNIGADIFLRLLTEVDEVGYKNDASSYGTRLLLTYDIGYIWEIPTILHFNIGYLFDNSEQLLQSPRQDTTFPADNYEYALGVNHDDQILGALALEFPFKTLTPYLEYSAELFNDNDISFNENPQRITPGIRYSPISQLAFDLAIDWGLTKKSSGDISAIPDWTTTLGISVIVGGYNEPKETQPVIKGGYKEEPSLGIFTGRVTDLNGDPLIAVISFNSPNIQNLTTDFTTGNFWGLLKPGEYRVNVSVQGYTQITEFIIIENRTETKKDFILEKAN